MRLLEPMTYENTYALAMRREQAEELGITKISELVAHESELRAGFTLEFIDREDGYRGIQNSTG